MVVDSIFFRLFLGSVIGDVVQKIDLSDNSDNDGTFFHAVVGICW